MHGLGNDFVVFDATREAVHLTPEQARFIADRHFGIGCDQILLVEPPRTPQARFSYRILNADGSEAGQCGNGARCFARFVLDRGLTDAHRIVVDIADGCITLEALGDHQYRVALGIPQFEPERVPLMGLSRREHYVIDNVAGRATVTFQALSLGNPHAVLRTKDVAGAPVASIGSALQTHAAFPERVNVGFMQIVDRGHIRLRVFERGVGETLACGSGAAAAAVAGMASGDLDSKVAVDLPGGRAVVDWQGDGTTVHLSGPASHVFDGELVSWSENRGGIGRVIEPETYKT